MTLFIHQPDGYEELPAYGAMLFFLPIPIIIFFIFFFAR